MKIVFKLFAAFCIIASMTMFAFGAYSAAPTESPELGETTDVEGEADASVKDDDGEKSPQTGDYSPATVLLATVCGASVAAIYLVNTVKKKVE